MDDFRTAKDGFYIHGRPPYEHFKLHIKPKGKRVELTMTGVRETHILTVVLPQATTFSEIKSALRKKQTRTSGKVQQ
jgi:hypothetical protein